MVGDSPGWILAPSDDLIFVQQKCPPTTEELEALTEAIMKYIRGKPKDPRASILDRPTGTRPSGVMNQHTRHLLQAHVSCVCSSSPLALHSHPTFSIVKPPSFQIIYDASNTSTRIVALKSTISKLFDLSGQWTGYQLDVILPPSPTPDHPRNTPFNAMHTAETLYKDTSVKYTNLISLRQFLRRWRNGRNSLLDLSTAYNHGKLGCLFSMVHGVQFCGMFFRYNSFSFGANRSCLSFQNFTSAIVYLCQLVGGERLWSSTNGAIANYLGSDVPCLM